MRPPVTVPAATVRYVVSDWPRYSRRVADEVIKRYGLPNEVTDTMLLWHSVRPWKRMVVHREGIPHNFPRPHLDLLEQTVDYRMPVNKHGELAAFEGSIIVDRTRGEVSVCSNSEEMNKLVLNLAHDIVMGQCTVAEARQIYTNVGQSARITWPEPYTQELKFATGMNLLDRESFTADPDQRARAS